LEGDAIGEINTVPSKIRIFGRAQVFLGKMVSKVRKKLPNVQKYLGRQVTHNVSSNQVY